MGDAYSYKGLIAEAVSAYQTALAVDPGNRQSYLRLGSAYTAQGDVSNALDIQQRTINLWPRLGENYAKLAETYLALDDTDQAVAYYEQAIQVDPDYADAYVGLGRILYAETRDATRALELFDTALALDDQATMVYQRYLVVCRREGRDLVGEYEDQAELAPDAPASWIALGAVYEWEGRVAETITAFERAVTLAPTYKDGYRYLALLYQRDEKFGKARGAWGQYLALRPVGVAEIEAHVGFVNVQQAGEP